MALTRAKYRRIPELYTPGTTVELKDGTPVWLQIMNPFQRDEAVHDAQIVRARLITALRSEHASDERLMVRASFLVDGREKAVARLVTAKVGEKLMDILTELRDDPEWKERLEIVDRSDELMARPVEDAERQLLNDTNRDYITEVTRRQEAERDYQQHRLDALDDDALVEEYVDIYIERRGAELATAEYGLTELWYSARVCDGTQDLDGTWDHSACEGHQVQMFETKADARSAPEELQDVLLDALRGLAMTARDARFSDRQGSSSPSSPLPSEEGASTPSTPDATPSAAPGPSTSPSSTR